MNETSDSDKPEAATPSPPMLTEGKPEILQPQRNSGRLADKWMTRRGGLKFPEFLEQSGYANLYAKQKFWKQDYVQQKLQDLMKNKISWTVVADQLGVSELSLRRILTTRHGFKEAKTSPEAKKRLACLKKAQSKKKSKQSVSKTSPVGESRNKKTRSEKPVFQEPELSPMEKIQKRNIEERMALMVKLGLIKPPEENSSKKRKPIKRKDPPSDATPSRKSKRIESRGSTTSSAPLSPPVDNEVEICRNNNVFYGFQTPVEEKKEATKLRMMIQASQTKEEEEGGESDGNALPTTSTSIASPDESF